MKKRVKLTKLVDTRAGERAPANRGPARRGGEPYRGPAGSREGSGRYSNSRARWKSAGVVAALWAVSRGDDPLAVELAEVLIEGLHAKEIPPLLDDVLELGGPVLADVLLHGLGLDHDLQRTVRPLESDLGNSRWVMVARRLSARRMRTMACSSEGKTETSRLMVRAASVVCTVESTRVARLRGLERDVDRLRVAHLAHEDDVRVPGAGRHAGRWRSSPCPGRSRAGRWRT